MRMGRARRSISVIRPAVQAAFRADTGAMPRPKGLRAADEVVPRLGVPAGLPAVRIGDVAAYDRPIEHLAGQLDRAEPEPPLRHRARRFGTSWVFAPRPIVPRAAAQRRA